MKKAQEDAAMEKIMEAWKTTSGSLYNEAYERYGPKKHDIEEMQTDAEYEASVVDCVIDAWGGWKHADKPSLLKLEETQQVKVVSDALNHADAKYGWYRGDLPSDEAIKRALESR